MRERIVDEYVRFVGSDISKIYVNEYFGYRKVCVEQPLLENGVVQKGRDGSPKPDTSKRDYERIPLLDNVQGYLDREVSPHVKNYWVNDSKSSIGYEINFSRYFYEHTPPRSTRDILKDILQMEKESDGLLKKLSEGL